jgi:glycosyltransferase involved in cell wall biosynthesis
VTCRAGDAKDLAEAVRRLHAMPRTTREEMGRAGRSAFLASYSRRVLLDQYESILSGMVRGQGSERGGPCGS